MAATGKEQDVAACVRLPRLRADLERLFELGKEDGRAGAWRLAFSPADVRGRSFVLELMRDAGLAPRVDAAGNLIGAHRGRRPELPSLTIGSHIDTVPGGGMFDGALGVLGGIETLRAMRGAGYEPLHTVEVIAFSNEEKARFAGPGGSRAMVSGIGPGDLEGVRDAAGVLLTEAMSGAGLDPSEVAGARRPAGFCGGYLELHVEQGGRMDRDGIQIGAVTAIVAITRARVVFLGKANHAGTTVMTDRRDALWAAADLVGDVREAALAEKGELVGTVGVLEVSPGAANVIPGRAELSIELRSADEERIRRVLDGLLARARELATVYGLKVEAKAGAVGRSVPMDATVVAEVQAAAAGLGLRCEKLPSWAGHDASQFAPVAPAGMIFVPSIGGVSHAPGEKTSWEDAASGVKVLAVTLCRLDRLWAPADGG